MKKKRNYDNDGLDPSEEYFRKKKKILMMIPIFLQKNQNPHIIKKIRKFVDRFFKMKKSKKFKYD